jgi:hypothetical protein
LIIAVAIGAVLAVVGFLALLDCFHVAVIG